MENSGSGLGTMLRQRRIMLMMTQRKLSELTGISPSYLGRVEKGERHPSASMLKKLAEPLGFTENELFSIAGFLSPQFPSTKKDPGGDIADKLDPYVSLILSREPFEVQRTVIGILSIIKSLSRNNLT